MSVRLEARLIAFQHDLARLRRENAELRHRLDVLFLSTRPQPPSPPGADTDRMRRALEMIATRIPPSEEAEPRAYRHWRLAREALRTNP